ncbi:MAG: alpha-L-fucosidase precursor [Verrucomicrobia bacterium]|nr:MAG: alpha-L-fucosidase precursor [Verrucomicrobiota bacterium]
MKTLTSDLSFQALNRRDFISVLGKTSAAVVAWGAWNTANARADGPPSVTPAYLKDYAGLYRSDPRRAALQWFREARFGLFVHYGLFSLEGRDCWLQYREKIPVSTYAKLKERFTAAKFDADFITDLACAAQMRYVNLVTRHHDSFCLFATNQTDFSSVHSPAKRDLVAELAAACQKKGLGLCLYYSHGRDWRHPHAPNNDEWGGGARPNYNPPEPSYATGQDHDLGKYLDFMRAQLTELLTNYGPIAAIWLDGISVPLSHKDRLHEWHLPELFAHIRSLQPQVLVSYKQGLVGTEDFLAPERRFNKKSDRPLELCDTLQPDGWGYMKADEGKHKIPDQVLAMLAKARRLPANLLLNTGPLPDGSIHTEDVQTLREVGRRIREQGWPAPTSAGKADHR